MLMPSHAMSCFYVLLYILCQVGNRRDKVAKASKALWKLMDGDEDSDDGDEVFVFVLYSRFVKHTLPHM